MAAILISVGNINFDNTWLAIGDESIYVRSIVVAHGEIIEMNAKQRLIEAFKDLN